MAPATQAYVTETAFDTRPVLLTPDEPNYNDPTQAPHVSTEQAFNPAVQNAERDTSRPKQSRRTPPSKNDGGSGLRFFVVDHPDQLRDRGQMRKNRKHVMHDYLHKAALDPNSKDSRVRKQSQQRDAQDDMPPTPPEYDKGHERLHENFHDEANRSKAKRFRNMFQNDIADQPRGDGSTRKPRSHERPLVEGIGGRFENSRYQLSAPQDIPFLKNSINLGGDLEPFDTWPSFDDPSFGINELKFSCSQRFGSQRLSVHWIPTMLRARHAFLSTLCISSAHDNIMRRNLLPHDKKTTESLMKRLQVRERVISLINESISDPEMRAADETIIAVLHVLNSEIMGCDDRSMRIHQIGLHQMVRERGGLHKLGLNGQLASILTISMFLLAALRETVPDIDYTNFANAQPKTIQNSVGRLPESPICCRTTGFSETISDILPRVTYDLLENLRQLTCSFDGQNTQDVDTTSSEYSWVIRLATPDQTVSDLCTRIYAARPGWEMDFDDMNARYTYESLRLAAVVYASAIDKGIPISKAAAQIGDRKTRHSLIMLPDTTVPVPIMIKHAIMRTDTSFCWDHLAGVLFWITLVGGAAGNPGPLANEEREGYDELARKWITAIAVRCCIVLSFEYGSAILETLNRFVGIETKLAGSSQQAAGDDGTAPWTWTETDPVNAGPPRPPMSGGFAEFVQEFQSTWDGRCVNPWI
jgi:hypothetical protein